jgi:hypothetical protein
MFLSGCAELCVQECQQKLVVAVLADLQLLQMSRQQQQQRLQQQLCGQVVLKGSSVCAGMPAHAGCWQRCRCAVAAGEAAAASLV